MQVDQFKEQRLDEARKVRGEAYKKVLDSADRAERGVESIVECLIRRDSKHQNIYEDCRGELDSAQEAVDVLYASRDAVVTSGSREAIEISEKLLYSVASESMKGFKPVRPYIPDLSSGSVIFPYYEVRPVFQKQMCIEVNPLPTSC